MSKTIRLTESQLKYIIEHSNPELLEEGKFKNFMGALAMAGAMAGAGTMQSCSPMNEPDFNHTEQSYNRYDYSKLSRTEGYITDLWQGRYYLAYVQMRDGSEVILIIPDAEKDSWSKGDVIDTANYDHVERGDYGDTFTNMQDSINNNPTNNPSSNATKFYNQYNDWDELGENQGRVYQHWIRDGKYNFTIMTNKKTTKTTYSTFNIEVSKEDYMKYNIGDIYNF